MAYSSITDIENNLDYDVLVYLTDDEDSGQINNDRIMSAIEKGDSIIDGYCQGRYSLPFDPVPKLIKGLSIDLGIYFLFSRRGFKEDSADKAIEAKYKNALKILQDIAIGKIQIGTGEAPFPKGEKIKIRARAKIFNSETLDKF